MATTAFSRVHPPVLAPAWLSALRLLFMLLCLCLLAACSRAPDETAVREAVQDRLQATFADPLLEIASLRRLGSAPLGTASDGAPRHIVYYNATLALQRDYQFSDWESLTPAALASLLGATEPGIGGIDSDGNAAGDELRVRGSVTFRQGADGWEPTLYVPPAGEASGPEDTAGSLARGLVEQIRAIVDRTPARQGAEARAIVAEELQAAIQQINLRLEQLHRAFVIAGGPTAGEYDLIARTVAAFGRTHGVQAASVTTDGSAQNVEMLRRGLASAALVQSDIAAMAYRGTGTFAARPQDTALRALGTLFPEPVQVIVRADGAESLDELRGRRVDLGLPASGSRATALAVLRAHGIEEADLAGITALGPEAAAQALARGEIDAFFAVIHAPARQLQRLWADGAIRMLPLAADAVDAMARTDPELVPVTLAPGTYPGQALPLRTVAVTALLVGREDLTDAEVHGLLETFFGGADFLAAGSSAGAMISPRRARVGLTIPMHPAAEAYFAQRTP
ncbi:TAXI family TRAP transporter solute-binding subunit [Verticiella sediminum]|uniref:TAXI family TRAP transporter solute-binding subunit n=1 Tax=Verticiella sediminum TaxID=1247510 RepID=A0A556AKK5_9BURK|nr:TAXI family TRAP transporter solute-binding subunit [Verticiella sediminum]TSH93410.1 TAXI family TRAP transporter solute-binding subunit [Verticiella sediminum]